MNCVPDDSTITNPCIAGSVTVHTHPSDMTKFIRCDIMGKMYITQCPNKETYDMLTDSCSNNAVGSSPGNALPDLNSYCSPTSLLAGDFYFPYPSDDTRFIQCDAFGRAWVRPCPAGLKWDDPNFTSSYTGNANPCHSGN